ncbi:single-stranded DNA-binding protein [Microbacterium suwonense]|uniref:Single-stranded DNA-binding protein n=1 Tax=Microbacterium suwonense TaxID=683047 RepID=A0ABM8FRL6_9MICO|nr:single-stranded DNA-binding protein [Microbacterium suwonense]BDZ38123.1 hypothetical protein GCM10025863_07370 [Microbacterium suwonense]
MSITNDTVTIAGNIGNDPIRNETRSGKPVVNFRVGSSSGYFDQRTGAWVDSGTNWYAVAAYGRLAEHAKASLQRGHAVIVSGRLKVREWEANGKKGVDVEIVADAIGHDLNWGTSAFVRRPRTTNAEAPSARSANSTDELDGADPTLDEPTAEEKDAWDTGGLQGVTETDVDGGAFPEGDASGTEDATANEELSYA